MVSRTGIGAGIGIPFRNNALSGNKPYLPPEIKDSLKAVVITYGKTNNDSDRAIVKNLVDPDNPFVISNAAFKLNSGFGKYSADFESFDWAVNISQKQHNKATISLNGRLCNHAAIEVDEMKVNIIGNVTELIYWYIANPDDTTRSEIRLTSGINTLPKSYAKDDGQTYNIGFAYISGDSEITIEQIPSFEGAFVTDGIDDLITSTKSATEMLDGSNEVTVVSMIHQIKTNDDVTRNNWFFTPVSYLENRVVKDKIGKTGIYGYTSTNVTNAQISDITPILGDKNDYTLYSKIEDGDRDYFTVEGFQNQGIWYVSSVAWYWTIIANKVLTTDQINQVIAYFNLDKTLKPDILCDVKKQGITNENHAEFGDKLIDFSGNGRDIQLNNLAWDGDSGIGKYNYPNWKVNVTRGNKYGRIVYYASINGTYSADFKGVTELYKSYGLSVEIRVNRANTVDFHSIKEDGIYTVDIPDDTTSIDIRFGGENVYNASCDITITQIPSHAGALCLDGVNDFGKVTGMPIYKDYTVIVERAITSNRSGIVSKVKDSNNYGAFILELDNLNYSFNTSGTRTTNIINDRKITYLSKYVYNGENVNVGNTLDSDIMWLGKVSEGYPAFSNISIYSLMLFPYSMSEFLIERQLKKHKLGTLYPDMVEFRPVIKANNDYEIVYTAIIKPDNWQQISVGDYVTVGESVAIQIKLNIPLEVTNVSSNSLADVSFYKEETGDNVYTIYGRLLDGKSPQKIGITIEQDENYVQWNPVVESNAEYKSVKYYKLVDTSWKVINVGDYVLVGQRILTQITTVGEDEVVAAVSEQLDIYGISKNSNGEYNVLGITSSESPQKINITIDEYIRYEDIVQPYPILLGLRDENGNEVSWGDKLRVGSTVNFTRGLKDSNLLYGMYKIDSIWLNNENVIVVADGRPLDIEKKMEFRAVKEWLLDSNEPKCILSPSRLRMPNSSYKILGHIPDISGHGNHGKINNSAYAKESGVNGYVENFNDWRITKPPMTVEKTDSQVHISYIGTSYKTLPMFEYTNPKVVYGYTLTVEITGIPSDCTGKFIHINTYTQEVTNGINTIKFQNDAGWFGFTFYREDDSIIGDCDITIKQIGEYEGAYCFDGVNDFVTIPTLSSGGKQMFMKVNWHGADDEVLYDQRNSNIQGNYDLAISTYPNTVAYNFRNEGGKTFIDGILNSHIITNNLKNITHNISSINGYNNDNNSTICIGKSVFNGAFAQMSLYDFMLFDNISTDDKIKELNEYVGIEAKVELPPYYWDAYGKTNLDVDKTTIQQRGVAEGDYDITNYNHAYDKMSGYGGYAFAKFDNTSEWIYTNNSDTIEVVNRDGYAVVLRKVGNGTNYWHFRNTIIKSLGQDIQIGVYANKSVQIVWQLKYKLEGETDYNTLAIASPTIEGNINTYVTLPYKTEQEIADLNAVDTYYSIYFIPIDLDINEEVTIEMLPLYPNGLLYDGATDYSKNVNIPAFIDDYTVIAKRTDLRESPNRASFINKSLLFGFQNGGAFSEGTYIDKYYCSSFGATSDITNVYNKEYFYQTLKSYNGVLINNGHYSDSKGLLIGAMINSNGTGTIGSSWKGVFYKLILYPKTIPLLQINFLKNLMERDEIIDLNNPIFIKE